VTLRALGGIDLGAVRLMTQRALLRDSGVRLAGMERLIAPVGMTSCRGAAPQRISGPPLLVWIVAHAARLPVRIARGIKIGELGAHLVTAKALVRAGPQCACSRVARGEQRHFRGELMARDAVKPGLARHFAEIDLRADVTTRLSTGRVNRYEAVHLDPVTGRALHILQGARV